MLQKLPLDFDETMTDQVDQAITTQVGDNADSVNVVSLSLMTYPAKSSGVKKFGAHGTPHLLRLILPPIAPGPMESA
jgi:hypothetical protein